MIRLTMGLSQPCVALAIAALAVVAAQSSVQAAQSSQSTDTPAPSNDIDRPKGSERAGSWYSITDYPAKSRRRGEQGVANILLDIDAKGIPVACRIVHSSSYPDLDNASCDLALKRARFSPARDANGKAVASTFAVPVRWALKP